MPSKKRIYVHGIQEEQEIREALLNMVGDSTYNTQATYTAMSITYPDGHLTFVEKHMRYLNAHPKLDAKMYLANLRLKTRVRS
jgi:hypothetical protein